MELTSIDKAKQVKHISTSTGEKLGYRGSFCLNSCPAHVNEAD